MPDNLQQRSILFSGTFSICRQQISDEQSWIRLISRARTLDSFPAVLAEKMKELQLPPYISELAGLEYYVSTLAEEDLQLQEFTEKLTVNPTLKLFQNSWKNLWLFFADPAGEFRPQKGPEQVLIWRHPANGSIKIKPAGKELLLSMKMAFEELSAAEVADRGGIHSAAVETMLIKALNEGAVTGPEPLIKRELNPADFKEIDRSFFTPRIFSLQWHITQACDLHCRHCYDRKHYSSLSLAQEIAILDDLARFCSTQRIHGQVTFTGGNPLLHPDFQRLYREAADRGFTLALLGNPASRKEIEELLAIQPPAFYQVSLEGLEEHNDYMRGQGHFDRVLNFLDLLRDLKIFSMVMLTLTRDNMDQVLPLAGILNKRADLFNFNRLSMVGEGANLAAVDKSAYPGFLQSYLQGLDSNPCLGLKDNLMNILRHQEGRGQFFGGCTGFGCGAAFNFITVLADGSVHACRKFPSPLGNITEQPLSQIYHSKAAGRYRSGPAACRDCVIRPVCGGCLAITYSSGQDIFQEKDPYCFIDSLQS